MWKSLPRGNTKTPHKNWLGHSQEVHFVSEATVHSFDLQNQVKLPRKKREPEYKVLFVTERKQGFAVVLAHETFNRSGLPRRKKNTRGGSVP